MALIINPNYELYERNDKAFCSSRQVAESFEKRHDHVLRDIQKLDCSENFRLLNFGETFYKDEWNRKQPEYLMTKDGFIFLVMGYRGKKAAALKEAYIKRFNDMEAFIKNLITLRGDHPEFTEAVMEAHEEPKNYHYSNEVDMINRIVLGVSAKKFKELNGIPLNAGSIRPFLSDAQAKLIYSLQRADIGLLAVVSEFAKRKEILTGIYQRKISRALRKA